jgi:hypothetical protein
MQLTFAALGRAFIKAGINSPARISAVKVTARSSSKVNPFPVKAADEEEEVLVFISYGTIGAGPVP